MYQTLNNGSIQHLRTLRVVPEAADHPDRIAYETWLANGNRPAPSRREAIRAERWEQIKAHRDAIKNTGVKVGEHWFHSDAGSRTQQLGLVLMGAGVPPVPWQTLGGDSVTMTPAIAQQILAATAMSDMRLFEIAKQHKAAMEKADDPDAYDIYTGWPETFGGAA